jgi:CelD/BcsL family acetyltransferase involved in cellulose biosynthesis
MYESRIAADQLTVAAVEGVPPAIDALAVGQPDGHGFLRAAWYAAGAGQGCRTLVLRRGADEGTILAAIPTAAHGPALAGVRKVPGSYWPLRTALIAPECSVFELAHGLHHRAARCLGAVWRAGPVRCDDPATDRLIAAAQLANWSVLSRPAGTSWVIDLDAARAAGFPRASTAKRLAQYWRKLEALGTPRWRHVSGSQWDAGGLEDMGKVEAESWIASGTDGRGAKFMTPAQRQLWLDALKDPVLADMLTATILMLDDRPIAFSFDLDDGPVQYGIAGSYVQDLKHLCIGKLANYRAMEDAIADGQSVMDMGAGDTGYKREMGAVEGYDMADLLFVRHRAAARVLARAWGELLAPRALPSLSQGQPTRG